MKIQVDDLSDGLVVELLIKHRKEMELYSPIESIHALEIKKLTDSKMTLWSARKGEKLAGCGGLMELSEDEAEIKSMRTQEAFLRQGVASQILQEILQEAVSRGYQRLYLETGSHSAFLPAVRLYTRMGFLPCGPFADYVEDTNSRFFYKLL